MDSITFLEEDKKNIFIEQQKALEYIFEKLDLSKIAFVGGIADYINLREYYQMPINDLDIAYENENDIISIIENMKTSRHQNPFYKMNDKGVLVTEFSVNGKQVHMDFYQRDFFKLRLKQSALLGNMVWHVSFKEMKKFHNSQIPVLTSRTMGSQYEWKRLYKHSKKASLYNNIGFLEEKGTLDTFRK